MNFQVIRNLAAERHHVYSSLPMTRGAVGYRIGNISDAIKGAATAAGIGYNGDFREARLRLASEVFQKRITSYNDLTNGELDALYYWATTQGLELKNWLIQNYGKQDSFLED